jgi:hypothetical protein
MKETDFNEGKYSESYYSDTLPRLIERAFQKALDWEKAAAYERAEGFSGAVIQAESLSYSYLSEAAELEARLIQWKRFNHEV